MKMTFRRLSPTFGIALLAALAMAACGGVQGGAPGAAVTATPALIMARDTRVVADGRLVPRRWAALSSSAGGRVIEVAAVEGDPVSAGDLLLRVDGAPQRAALAEAEAALAGARAQAAQLRAGATAEERAGAEAAVAAATAASQAAEGALATARANLARLTGGATAEEREIAQHSLEAAKNALWAAQGQRDAVCGGSGGAPGACDAAKGAAQQAEEQVRIAEVRLRQVEQGAGVQEISAARGQVQQAEGQLAAARADVAQAEAALARTATGATAEALAAADAQVAQAEAAVARARLAVERCALLAPYDGVIVAVTARLGEEIGPGVPALQIADTGAWRVETDDLTELDVVRVAVGQRATVVPDALSDLALEGIVAAVSEMPEDRAGEVLYKVTIDLPEPDPRLRWGMTVAVTFEE